MNDVERAAVESMLRMRPNKKILQAELLKDTGKYVMLKDIHNMQTRISPKSDADALLAEMRNVPIFDVMWGVLFAFVCIY